MAAFPSVIEPTNAGDGIARRCYIAIAVALCLYDVVAVVRMSFIVNGVRYFTLADDQMISMRYAENLAHGYGLVWNPGGGRLEGFTNFLWVLYMAFFRWLGIKKPLISLAIQVSGGLFLAATLVFVKRIATRLSGSSRLVPVVAVAFTAFYFPLDNWALQGTEVSVLTMIVAATTAVALESLERTRSPISIYLLLGCATLIRPDMFVIAGAMMVALVALGRKEARPSVCAGAIIVAAFLIGETAFRLWYFGDPLPNTYYLKLTGFPLLPRLTRGTLVTLRFFAQCVPYVVPVVLSRLFLRPSRETRLLAAVFVAQVGYSIWVGGDAWEWWGGSNRYIAIVMPLLFCIAAAALVRLSMGTVPNAVRPMPTRPFSFSRREMAVVVALTIVTANYLAVSTSGSPLRRLLLLDKPPDTDLDESRVRAGVALRTFTDDRAVIGVITAGNIPFFSERQSIDLLGKMDAYIAHEPMHVPDGPARWLGFLPGHLKWDYEYSIGRLKPDVIQGREDNEPEKLPNYVARDYREVFATGRWYVRVNSSHVLWNHVPPARNQGH